MNNYIINNNDNNNIQKGTCEISYVMIKDIFYYCSPWVIFVCDVEFIDSNL